MSKGKLVAVYGPMFSGKTTYIIEAVGTGRDAVVFKPDLDARYTKRPVVVSHNQAEIPAVLVNHKKPWEMSGLVGEAKRIFIDEVNFFDEQLVEWVSEMLDSGREVTVAGLVYDSEGEVFGPMLKLIQHAEEKIEIAAKCDGEEGKCPLPATRSYRKTPKTEQVRVAGADEYGAACEDHYSKLHHRPVQ